MRYREIMRESESIRWVIPKSRRLSVSSGEAVPVQIDVRKLDASWAKDEAYIGPGGAGGIRTRYPDFGTWFQGRSEPVEMPEVAIGAWGYIVFANGRHRFSWLRDQGIETLPVLVPAEQAAEITRQFGA